MSSKVESQESERSGGDLFKLVLAVALVVAGVAGFYYFDSQILVVRVLGVLIAVAMGLALVSWTKIGAAGWGFLRESNVERRKVLWPTRAETSQTTMVVLFVVVLMGVLLWLLDMFLGWGVRILTSAGG